MDPIQSSQTKKPQPKFQNFLEAFKDTKPGSRPAAKTNAPQENFDFESFLNQREAQIRQQERQRLEQQHHEEYIIYSRDQQQEKLEIQALQQEIKKLAKEVGGVMVEAEKTAFQMVVAPGKYHKNFFKRLISLLELARKSVHEGRTCLQITNLRNRAKSAYWAGVSKAGTSFMLSSDRTVATQAG